MLMLVMMYCMPDCCAMTGICIANHPPLGTCRVHWPGKMEDSIGLVLGIKQMHKYFQKGRKKKKVGRLSI